MRQLLGCCLAAVLLLSFSRTTAAQQPATPAVMPAEMNSTAAGDFSILLAPDGDVLVRADDLRRAGLSSDKAERMFLVAAIDDATLAGANAGYISVRAMSPLLTARIDEAALALVLAADPSLFGATMLRANSLRPDNIEYSKISSAFLNYGLSSAGGHTPSFVGEFGSSIRGTLFYTSFNRSSEGRFERNMTNVTFDEPTKRRRWIAGDNFVSTADVLGGGAAIAGVTVGRNYTVDPYFLRQATASLQGNAITPSTVTVYVNGARVTERQVPPGQFELTEVPLTVGAGQVTVVVKDAFGRETVQSRPFYSSNVALARGLTEYEYSIGKLRVYDSSSSHYTDEAFLARHRVGITDWFTLGARAEGSRGLWSAGPNTIVSTRFGDFGVSFAASDDHGTTGQAGYAEFNRVTRRLSFGAQLTSMSREYVNLSLPRDRDRALTQSSIFASYSFPRLSLTAIASKAEMRDTGSTHGVTALGSLTVSSRVTAVASAGFLDTPEGRRKDFTLGVSVYLGRGVGVNTTVGDHDGRRDLIFELQRPLPQGTGYGYRIRSSASEGSATTSTADLQYQSFFGRHEVVVDPQDPSNAIVSTAGGVIFESGRFALARPVQDSFALVRVPGVAGVRVYSANQLIGKTDARGDLIVPSVLSYYANDLRIDDRDVPIDYRVDAVERRVAPPYRGGALALFPVERVRTIVGRIRVRVGADEVIPSYGQLTITQKDLSFTSPVGGTGEFYLENVPSGAWDATIEWTGGACKLKLEIGDAKGVFADVGTVTCTMEGRTR